jgi:hypothetical protein
VATSDKRIVKELLTIAERVNATDFFKEVSSLIHIKDQSGNVLEQLRLNESDELLIEIIVNNAGSISFTHALCEDYLNEFLPIWEEEALKRGLDVSVSKLREEIVTDYTYLIFPDLKVEDVAQVLEGLYTLQLLTKFILKNGKLPEGFWYPLDSNFDVWRLYFSIHPIMAGILDGYIDEIISLPDAFVTLYELLTSDTKQAEIMAKFTAVKVCTDLIELYQNEDHLDEHKSQHRAGVAFISVGAMLSPEFRKFF